MPTRTAGSVAPVEPGVAPKIGIVIVAYNAASTLERSSIAFPIGLRPQIAGVLVSDDASQDSTFLVGLGYQQLSDLPLTVIRQEQNLGYGGNQKAAYHWAIEHDLDIVVLLHGDGQYAPEELPNIVEPLVDGECDAVFGSRMMEKGAARRGGMPLYKFVGNRILTTVPEHGDGHRPDRMAQRIPRLFGRRAARDPVRARTTTGSTSTRRSSFSSSRPGKRIVEIPIPTYYGDEICYVNGLGYARDVVTAVTALPHAQDRLRHRRHRFASQDYEVKEGELSSHHTLARLGRGPARPGACSTSGARAVSSRPSCASTGTGSPASMWPKPKACASASTSSCSPISTPGINGAVTGRVRRRASRPMCSNTCADPERVLEDARALLAPGGVVVACVPNFGHWYPRLRVASGTFAYERRGILDAGHVRFFTRRTFHQLVAARGLRRRARAGARSAVRGPGPGRQGRRRPRVQGARQRSTGSRSRIAPSLFAYQFLAELRPTN